MENNLLALAIDAARAKATVGEISDALEKVYGRHQAEIRALSGVYRDEAGRVSNIKAASDLVEKSARPRGVGHVCSSPRWASTVTIADRR
jgi:methylmalonyl-CoA mutase